MLEDIIKLIDSAIAYYTKKEFQSKFDKAQKQYFDLSGEITKEHEDFDERMKSFYEWFLFDFDKTIGRDSLILEYAKKNRATDEIILSLTDVHFSVYEYSGQSFFGKKKFKDFFERKIFALTAGHRDMAIIENDVFTARSFLVNGNITFLTTLVSIASDARKIIKKEAVKVRKMGSPSDENNFVLQVESLNRKLQVYRHVSVDKIFKFN